MKCKNLPGLLLSAAQMRILSGKWDQSFVYDPVSDKPKWFVRMSDPEWVVRECRWLFREPCRKRKT